mgnify:CR=1 FL=1
MYWVLVSLKPDLPEQVEPTGFSIMTFLVSLKQELYCWYDDQSFSIMTFLVSLKQTFKELVSLIYITTLQKKL